MQHTDGRCPTSVIGPCCVRTERKGGLARFAGCCSARHLSMWAAAVDSCCMPPEHQLTPAPANLHGCTACSASPFLLRANWWGQWSGGWAAVCRSCPKGLGVHANTACRARPGPSFAGA